MNILFFLIFLLSVLGNAATLRFCLHMYQLNSYKPAVQRRWLRDHAKKLTLLCLPVAGGFFFLPRKGKTKKPLVFTARVKRLCVAAILLVFVYFAVLTLLFKYLFPLPAVLCICAWVLQPIIPFLLLLADFLCRPIENAVRTHYTKEAKKILAAHKELLVIGITGSFGKTSVKHFLQTLLQAKYNVFMTPGGVNTPMGVVRAIREGLDATHEIFLCEMGAKQSGDITELCTLVRPRWGVITAVGPQHLESFHTLENVVRTKFELAQALPAHGKLFLNCGDTNIAPMQAHYPNAIPYTGDDIALTSGYTAQGVQYDERGVSFTLVTPGGETERFATSLIGQHNVINLVGSLAVAHSLGISLAALKGRVRKILPVPHRLELLRKSDALLVIDDAYNANPAGAKAALDTLALFNGTKILVTPGMIELGPEQTRLNRIFGTQAAAVADYVALVGEKQTRPILEGLLDAGYPKEKILIRDALLEIMPLVYALPFADRKIILLENDLPDNF